MMRIRRFEPDDLDAIKRIIRKLHPQWFDREALKRLPIDVGFQRCFVAEAEGGLIGFISSYAKEEEAEVSWIAVTPEWRGKGVGKKLLGRAEEELKGIGVKDLRVETVGEASPRHAPYEKTVMFYRACGFRVEEELALKKEMGYSYRMYRFKKTLS